MANSTVELEEIPMPNSDVTPVNALDRLMECQDYVKDRRWEQFIFLWRHIVQYQQSLDFPDAKEGDEFITKFQKTQDKVQHILLEEIQKSETFEIFHKHLTALAAVVNDTKQLWDIIHTKISTSLKVTLRQSHEIAALFFKPNELFEYGFDAFASSSICDFVNITNEEAVIDIFYATAGFVRACSLDPTYEAKIPSYEAFITKILKAFMQLPDFDAHRFVWLVETINKHLHLPQRTFKTICSNVIQDFIGNSNGTIQNPAMPTIESSNRNKLYKLCVISTSPFLHQGLPMLREAIDNIFQQVILEQRHFLRKYIFIGYPMIDWTGSFTRELSDPLRAWRLMLTNLLGKLQEQPEIPNTLLIDFIDDSLSIFTSIYGEIQPDRGRGIDMRLDIFAIVDIVSHSYPTEMPSLTLKRIWYLLYIAAIIGAKPQDLQNIQYEESPQPDMPYLGLDRTPSDFIDYPLALARIGKKFENESDDFPAMIEFLRKRIDTVTSPARSPNTTSI